MTENEELADELEPYFRSGNDVQVERATIPAELAKRVIAALRAIPAAVTSKEVEALRAIYERFETTTTKTVTCPKCQTERADLILPY